MLGGGDVPDVVQGLDCPVPANQLAQTSEVGLFRGGLVTA